MNNAMDTLVDFYYEEIDNKLNMEFIKDDNYHLLREKLANKISTIYTVEDIDYVLRLSNTIYEAISSPNFYINRGINVSGEKVQLTITSILDSMDEFHALAKNAKLYLIELSKNSSSFKERLDNNSNIKNSYDDCYNEEPGTRLPNLYKGTFII